MLLGRCRDQFSREFNRQAQSSAGGELRYCDYLAQQDGKQGKYLETGGLQDSAIGCRRDKERHDLNMHFAESLLSRDVSFLGNGETKTLMVPFFQVNPLGKSIQIGTELKHQLGNSTHILSTLHSTQKTPSPLESTEHQLQRRPQKDFSNKATTSEEKQKHIKTNSFTLLNLNSSENSWQDGQGYTIK